MLFQKRFLSVAREFLGLSSFVDKKPKFNYLGGKIIVSPVYHSDFKRVRFMFLQKIFSKLVAVSAKR